MAQGQPLRLGVPWDIQSRFRTLPTGTQQTPEERRDKEMLARMIYPPSVEKLPESVDFNVQDFAMTLAAGAGSVISSTGLRIALPSGNVGWLQGFSFYLLTPTALTSVQFAVRISNSPVPGWSNLQNSPGAANLYREDFSDLRVKIPDGAVVDVLITNLNANGPWTVGGRLQGWFHSAQAELSRFPIL